MDERKIGWLHALLVGIAVTISVYFIQTDPSIPDCDAVAYLVGAYSLQTAGTYTDLSGRSLNHYPVGYSYLLSHFSNPLTAAKHINYIALGLLTGALFHSLRSNGARGITALSITLVLGLGFFRGLAVCAKADILCFAVFLVATKFYYAKTGWMKLLPLVILGALIPLKLIALSFLPGVLLAEVIARRSLRLPVSIWIVGILSWVAGTLIVLAFNYYTDGQLIPVSHANVTWGSLVKAVEEFIKSYPRDVFAYWYGTIKPLNILLPFLCVLAWGSYCFATLIVPQLRRISDSAAESSGSCVLMAATLMQFKRVFEFNARLSGYGPLAFLTTLKIKEQRAWIWPVYAVIFLALAGVNTVYSENRGGNHPLYRKAVMESGDALNALRSRRDEIATNTYNLLDCHAHIASRQVLGPEMDVLPAGTLYWRINLPNFDSIATIVEPVNLKDNDWELIQTFASSEVYRKK